jgi:hypothetical protein
MNPYVEAGYAVILGTLGSYSVSLVARERAARRRVGAPGKAAGAADAAAGPDEPPSGASP